MTNAAGQLKQYCDLLLHKDADWAMRRQQLENMHSLFVELGALNAYSEARSGNDLDLHSGKAIAPVWAAMCLFDIARTIGFVSALRSAVTAKHLAGNKTVQVLEAGCGPYGLLSLLTSLYFLPGEVSFTLIDIHPENITSVKKLTAALQIEPCFTTIQCSDALHYHWPQQESLHILVIETMNRALWKEPQVDITLHLAPQMEPAGILIPEEICIHLVATDLLKRKQIQDAAAPGTAIDAGSYETRLGQVLRLTKSSTADNIDRRPLYHTCLPLIYSEPGQQLELQTEIKLFNNYWLRSNESAITLPLLLRQRPAPGEDWNFCYDRGNEPGLVLNGTKC